MSKPVEHPQRSVRRPSRWPEYYAATKKSDAAFCGATDLVPGRTYRTFAGSAKFECSTRHRPGTMIFTHALLRLPGENFAQGLTQSGEGAPDPALALVQHQHYRSALEAAGLTLTVLPPGPAPPGRLLRRGHRARDGAGCNPHPPRRTLAARRVGRDRRCAAAHLPQSSPISTRPEPSTPATSAKPTAISSSANPRAPTRRAPRSSPDCSMTSAIVRTWSTFARSSRCCISSPASPISARAACS